MNKRLFDGLFILIAAAVLIILNQTVGLENHLAFALIPILMAYYLGQYAERKFKNKDVVFLYLSLDKNKSAWESYIKSNDIQGVHLIASGGDVYKSQIAKLYKVKKLPTYFLIDKNGKIAFKPERGKNITRVEDKIKELL